MAINQFFILPRESRAPGFPRPGAVIRNELNYENGKSYRITPE